MKVERNIEALSRKYCCRRKAIYMTFRVCVLALLNRHAKRMLHTYIVSYVACLTVPHFSTLSHKRHEFREEKFVENIVFFFYFFLQRLSETFIIIRRIFAKNCHKFTETLMWSTPCSCQILITLEFSGRIYEKYSNTKFRENPSSGSRVAPCGQTDKQNMTKLAAAFHSSAQSPKKSNKRKCWRC
jgi:hypothetical protein